MDSQKTFLLFLKGDQFSCSKKIGIAIANRGDFQFFHEQELANIACTYAVANADAPMIFNNNFTSALLQMQHRFISEHYIQLYQWHLWKTRGLSHIGLPEDLRDSVTKHLPHLILMFLVLKMMLYEN
jgi:hypothetical protein